MNEHGLDEAIVDLARGAVMAADAEAKVRGHVAECPACAAMLQREEALTRGLRDLAEAASDAGPSAAMEAALLRAFAAAHRRRGVGETPGLVKPQTSPGQWQPWMAAAAALFLATVLTVGWRDFERTRGSMPEVPAPVALSEFVPWPGASTLPPFESGQLVRMELPASVLPLLGIARTQGFEGKVQADVVVGQDGFVRAVRLAR
jgi:hypothetical protein